MMITCFYLKHFVVTNFIETLTWWLKKGKSYKEDQVVTFYLDVIEKKSEKNYSSSYTFNSIRLANYIYFLT